MQPVNQKCHDGNVKHICEPYREKSYFEELHFILAARY